MNNKTVTLTKEQLSRAFCNAINDDIVQSVIKSNPAITLVLAHINCLIDRELFDK